MIPILSWSNIIRLNVFLTLTILISVNCLPNEHNKLVDDSRAKELTGQNQIISNLEEKILEMDKIYELLRFLKLLTENKINKDDYLNNFNPDFSFENSRPKRKMSNGFLRKFKRDCHLGLGMGYLCHAYSITKFAQHQKLLSDPKGPGKR